MHSTPLYFYSTPFVLLEGVHRDIDGEKGEDGEAPSRVYKGGMGLEPSLYPTWPQSIDSAVPGPDLGSSGEGRPPWAAHCEIVGLEPKHIPVLAPGDMTWLTPAGLAKCTHALPETGLG